MCTPCLLAVACVICGAADRTQDSVEVGTWSQWRGLAVEDEGRHKPLETLARESLRAIAQRTTLPDPESHETLDCVAVYLRMLFDWQEWPTVHAQRAFPRVNRGGYFSTHHPDKWDRLPMFPLSDERLRAMLGLSDGTSSISAVELCQAEIDDPKSGKRVSFLEWVEGEAHAQHGRSPELDEGARRLTARLNHYMAHRMGLRLKLLPVASDPSREWVSASQLWQDEFDQESDPTGTLREAQQRLRQLHAIYRQRDFQRFNELAQEFIAYVSANGPTLGPYPKRKLIDLELAYHRWLPMRMAAVASLCAFVLLSVGRSGTRRRCYAAGLTLFAAGLLVIVAGFGARVLITGWAPVTNMYETVVFTALGTGLLGLMLEWRFARGNVIAAAAVTSLMLILAEWCSTTLDQGLRPLPLALRSNFWLVTHVVTITLSYSAFGLALGIGNVTLGHYVARSAQWTRVDSLTEATYRCMQVGTVLLALGTATGGAWADLSWGRFWGWDPKEVWALITLLCYLAVLHARHAAWVGTFGLAALSVICFSVVIVTWYGVNYALGTGLHTYGKGSGGESLVFAMLFFQYAFVAVAAMRSAGHLRPRGR